MFEMEYNVIDFLVNRDFYRVLMTQYLY